MTARQLTPPIELAVDMDIARATLGADGTAMDARIEMWVRLVTKYAEHFTQRAFVTQAWRATFDCFPAVIGLDRPPLIAVQSVKYLDSAGVLQTLSPSAYVVDTISEPGRILPAVGVSWPATYAQFNAVVVDYTCGYGLSSDAMPDEIKGFIVAKVAEQIDAALATQRDLTHATVQASFLDHALDGVKNYG